MDEYYQVVQSLPSWLARPLLDMPSALAPDVQELRLRVGCAPAFTLRGAVCTPQETARELASLQRMLLTPQQKESCKAVKIELNEVIKKVGGDLFEGHYLTNPPSYGNKPAQKIRFAAEL